MAWNNFGLTGTFYADSKAIIYTAFEDNYLSGKLTEAGVISRLARMIRKEEGWVKPKKEEEEKVKEFARESK